MRAIAAPQGLRATLGARRAAALAGVVALALLLLGGDSHGPLFASAAGTPAREQAEAKLTVAEAEGEARAGSSVAISADGTTALVGGPTDGTYGAVWVFVREGGQWHQQGPKLQGGERSGPVESCGVEAGEEGEECNFGRSVSLSADGNTAVVGNPRESRIEPASEPGGSATLRRNVGAVWVYTRSGSTWKMSARLTGREEGGEGRFGKSVALSGDGQTLLVGGPSDRGGSGSAWIFTRTGEGWKQAGAKLGDAGTGEGLFGQSVSLSGNGRTAIVGAPGANGYAGSASIFAFDGSAWVQQGSPLTGPEETGAGHFGSSVALSGDASTALVGARLDGEGAGAAWAFSGSAGSWSPQGGKLTGGEGAQGFGYSLALSQTGGVAIIGSPHEGPAGSSAWQFERSGEAWEATEKLEPGISQVGHHERFGTAVAVSSDGTTALVGGPNDNAHAGAAYVFGEAPEVASVTPSQGPRGGGTEVTITGSNLTGATAVRFGSADAQSFTVLSSQTILARTPPGEGTVDVLVTSPDGTSLPGVAFRYLTHGGVPVPPSDPPPAAPGTSTAAPTGSPAPATSAGGVLPFVSSSGTCRVALASRKVSVARRARAAFRLRVTGVGRCAGKLRLRVSRRDAHKRLRLKTIGVATFSIPAGRSASVTVALNTAGRRALASHRWRLRANLLLVRQSPAPALAQTAAVRLVRASKRRPHA